jgi:hypothetical protein
LKIAVQQRVTHQQEQGLLRQGPLLLPEQVLQQAVPAPGRPELFPEPVRQLARALAEREVQLLGQVGVEVQFQLPVAPAPWLTNQSG